jgi:hypothetical protein
MEPLSSFARTTTIESTALFSVSLNSCNLDLKKALQYVFSSLTAPRSQIIMENLDGETLDRALVNAPYRKDRNGLLLGSYLFVYDHHLRYTEFLVAYPGSEFVGIGFMKNWEWHLNILGSLPLFPNPLRMLNISDQPNIRPLQRPAPNVTNHACAFGYIFRVTAKIDLDYYDALNTHAPRLRTCQAVTIRLQISADGQVAPVAAIVYYDPANTVSANMGATHTNAEKLKYFKGLDELLSMGAPNYILERVYQELYGSKVKGVGVNAAGGLLSLDMICPKGTLGIHKDDQRRIGSMGYDIKGARDLEMAKVKALMEAAAKDKSVRSEPIQVQNTGSASKDAVNNNGGNK